LEYNFNYSIELDRLNYSKHSEYSNRALDFITIKQFYSVKKQKFYYLIKFNLNFGFGYIIGGDYSETDREFIRERNNSIEELSTNGLSKKELYDMIFKDLAYLLSDEYNKKWNDEYIMKQDMGKYNI